MLALPAEATAALRGELAARACTLAQALDVDDASESVTFGRVAAAMQQGFAQVLQMNFQPGGLTPAEVRRAAELIRTQFGSDAWNRQR